MKLYSIIYGDKGHDLIIIHGLFGMSDNWNSLGKQFAKYCKVHLIDLRNHGRSPHSEDFNYKVMCEDVLVYMKYHKIQKPRSCLKITLSSRFGTCENTVSIPPSMLLDFLLGLASA